MQCPKCHHPQADNRLECERCGVIFSKYYQAQQPVTTPDYDNPAPEIRSENAVLQWLLEVPQDVSHGGWYARVILILLLFIWSLRFIWSPVAGDYAGESFLHLVNLPFHEAGHLFFRPFGQFISSLGGTLGQLLMPLICAGYFVFKMRDTFAATIALWWFGQNFFDIAPYINDARAGSLPLLGGNFGHSSPYGFHDWEYLLTETGLLQYDHLLAGLSKFTGCVIFVLVFIWAGMLLWKQWQSLKSTPF